jgi:hypothetical protein
MPTIRITTTGKAWEVDPGNQIEIIYSFYPNSCKPYRCMEAFDKQVYQFLALCLFLQEYRQKLEILLSKAIENISEPDICN